MSKIKDKFIEMRIPNSILIRINESVYIDNDRNIHIRPGEPKILGYDGFSGILFDDCPQETSG